MSLFKFLSYADAVAKARDFSNGATLFIADEKEAPKSLKDIFEIDGFSKVFPIWEVCRFNNGEYYEVRNSGNAVLLEDGRIYQIFGNGQGKYGLCAFYPVFGSFHYFKTEAVQPNFIGAGTKSKILAWADYCTRVEYERAEYKAANEASVDAQMERAAAKDGAKVERANNGKITRVEFTEGGIVFIVQRGEKWATFDRRYYYDFVVDIENKILGN